MSTSNQRPSPWKPRLNTVLNTANPAPMSTATGMDEVMKIPPIWFLLQYIMHDSPLCQTERAALHRHPCHRLMTASSQMVMSWSVASSCSCCPTAPSVERCHSERKILKRRKDVCDEREEEYMPSESICHKLATPRSWISWNACTAEMSTFGSFWVKGSAKCINITNITFLHNNDISFILQ